MTQPADEWYVIAADGTRQGPHGRAALLALHVSGAIADSAMIWSAGMTEWQPLAEVFKGNLPPSAPTQGNARQVAWFYLEANRQQGPVTEKSLMELHGAGKVVDATQVWTAGMKEWKPFSAVFPQQTSSPTTKAKPRRPSGCLTLLVFGGVMLILASIALPEYRSYTGAASTSARQDTSPGTATRSTAVDPRSKIADAIFKADAKSEYPSLARTLGKSWSRLQPAREAVALRVAANPRCDYVEVVEAAQRSTAGEIVFFVDCRNGERMYVSESDLKTGSEPAFQSQKIVDKSAAMVACREGVMKMVTFPESVDVHVLTGTAFSTHKTTGNARLLMDFDAKNALGAKLGYRATCIFPADGSPPEITINTR